MPVPVSLPAGLGGTPAPCAPPHHGHTPAPVVAQHPAPNRPQWLTWTSRLGLVVLLVAVLAGGRSPAAVGLVAEPWDKLAHLALFGSFTVLLLISRPATWLRSTPPWVWLALCILGGCALGAVDELHQATLPGRSSSWADWLADCLGALLGGSAWHLASAYLRHR